jgi:hypothetical protein
MNTMPCLANASTAQSQIFWQGTDFVIALLLQGLNFVMSHSAQGSVTDTITPFLCGNPTGSPLFVVEPTSFSHRYFLWQWSIKPETKIFMSSSGIWRRVDIVKPETSVNTIYTRRQIPEDDILHGHRRGNLISYKHFYVYISAISRAIIMKKQISPVIWLCKILLSLLSVLNDSLFISSVFRQIQDEWLISKKHSICRSLFVYLFIGYITMLSTVHIIGQIRWLVRGPRYRSSLSHYATSRKIAGSILDEIIGFFNGPNPSSRTMNLG